MHDGLFGPSGPSAWSDGWHLWTAHVQHREQRMGHSVGGCQTKRGTREISTGMKACRKRWPNEPLSETACYPISTWIWIRLHSYACALKYAEECIYITTSLQMPRKQGQEHRSFDACIFFGYRDRRGKGTLCTVQSSHQWGIVIRY